ncbi:hypothetical protein AB0H43_32175 [Hamadaea sp. NPDC050747]|uniref:hypothetical protein n=1 Tax=Hamadaea sp. NPDC050747 TaxID=3155789 RepID=UPI0033C75E55
MRRKLFTASIATATIVAAGLVPSAMSASAADGQAIYLAANGKTPASAAVAPTTAPVSVDSSLKLSDLTWTNWSDSTSNGTVSGTGTATVNLCDPNCATGATVSIPVTVTLSAPQHLCGNEFYTDMRLAFTGEPPAGLPSTTTVPVAPFC